MIPSVKQWKEWSLPSKYTTVGLLVGIVSLGIALFSFFPPKGERQNESYVQGFYVMTSIGEHDVFYGKEFVTPPNLEIIEGFDNPSRFSIIEQRVDGFRFVISGAVTSGTKLVWRANGQVKSANK